MIRTTSAQIILSATLALSVAPGVTSAASIAKSNKEGCAVALHGEIVAGDFANLSALAADVGWLEAPDSGEESNRASEALCLNSPGGSYSEGRLIAHYVHRHGITTRVPEGAACFSACAFAFMAGRAHGLEVDGPSRILHVNGHLGFHAPYFDIAADEALTGADLAGKLRLSNEVLADFIAFGSYASAFNASPMLSLSLLGEMLAAGPDELAMVDTIEKAARWGLLIEGYADSAQLSREGVAQACVNFQAWSLDRPSENVNPEHYPSFETVDGEAWGQELTFAVIETGGMERRNCHVELVAEMASGLAICSRDESNGLLLGDCPNNFAHWVPWYYGMEPGMTLVDLGRVGME